jgi:hypothetical protein
MPSIDPNQPSPEIDVFFSYRSGDRQAALGLKSALAARGLRVWIDVDELPPGSTWQPRIARALRAARSIAILVGSDGIGPWQDEEMQAALQVAVGERPRPVIPVLLSTASDQTARKMLDTTPEVPLFLANRTWVDLRPLLSEDGIDRLVWGITGQKPPDSSTRPADSVGRRAADDNPFDPWTPATPPRFCGREKLLRALQNALERGGSVSLLGDARIGKSSIVHTWALRARANGRLVAIASGEGPEAQSCSALVRALTGVDGAAASPDEAADQLAAWAGAAAGGLPPLLIVDEAEAVLKHLPHRFFERLRGMLGRLCLLLATRHEIGEIGRDDGLTSPLLNRLQVQRVGLLDDIGVGDLIARGDGVLTPGDAATLRRYAGRHPFYLTLLAHYLWQARCDGDGEAAALDAFREDAFQRLGEWWRALPAREQAALRGAAGAPPASDNALQRRGWVDDGRLFGEVLREWLTQHP